MKYGYCARKIAGDVFVYGFGFFFSIAEHLMRFVLLIDHDIFFHFQFSGNVLNHCALT